MYLSMFVCMKEIDLFMRSFGYKFIICVIMYFPILHLHVFDITILLLGLSLKSLLTELNSRTPTLTPNPNEPRTLTPHLTLTNMALQTVNSSFHQYFLI